MWIVKIWLNLIQTYIIFGLIWIELFLNLFSYFYSRTLFVLLDIRTHINTCTYIHNIDNSLFCLLYFQWATI